MILNQPETQKLPSLHHTNLRLRRNNFDLLRLLFAGTVCVVHAAQLSGYEKLAGIPVLLNSAVAVKAFFVISGFLVFMSFERSTSLGSYARKRIRRIYPAYFVVVMLCAFGLLIVSRSNPADYFSVVWFKYVAANLSFMNFLQPSLPGVFTANKLTVVNGSLWSLKVEAMFYVSIPFFVFLFRRLGCFPVLLIGYCSSVVFVPLMVFIARQTGSAIYLEFAHELPGQLAYFFSGAFFYYFLPLFQRRVVYFVTGGALVLLVNKFFPLPPIEPFALGAIVIFFGLFLYVGNFGKFGDLSYGVYILHFPIIQIFLQAGWFRERPGYFLMSVVATTFGGALASWHFVEKRWLARHKTYSTTLRPPDEELATTSVIAEPAG